MRAKADTKPSYILVQEQLRERILRGEWEYGQQIPTERQLETEFGFSRLTISKGLANLVQEGLLTRTQGRGTFVAHSPGGEVIGARKLIKYISPSSGRRGSIPSKYGALEAMHEILAPRGYEIGIDFYRTAEEQVEYIRKNDRSHCVAFITNCEPEQVAIKEFMRLQDEHYPFVLIDAYPPNLETDYVVTDNIDGACAVINHLASYGHRRIDYVTRPVDRSSLTDRLAGYIKGLVMNDLAISENNVHKLWHVGQEALGEVSAVVERILTQHEPPTAIFFCNDDLALEAVDYLLSRGVRIPEDISIVGYDNLDQTAAGKVPLTTMAQDFYQMAKRAAEILLSRLEGGAAPSAMGLLVKPTLVSRESVARVG